MEKLYLFFTLCGNEKWCSCSGKPYGDSSKHLKISLPYDPTIPLLGIYPKELKGESQRDICISMFIAVLSIIANSWRQHKCPLIDKWINTMRCIHTMEYYSGFKRKEILRLLQHRWNETVMPSEQVNYKRTNVVWFHLPEVFGQIQRQKEEWWLPSSDTEGRVEELFSGCRGSGLQDEKSFRDVSYNGVNEPCTSGVYA